MSLDKAVTHGKEHRKPYRKSKRFDGTCRNHGACSYCRDNRTYAGRRAAVVAEEQIEARRLDQGSDGLCLDRVPRRDPARQGARARRSPDRGGVKE